jgi:predicted DNA-binding mobile mystery protein A
MQSQEGAAQARRAIDRRFSQGAAGSLLARPRAGWIRAVRDALGMSQSALAARLGLSAPAVSKLEHSEARGGITLAKLDEVARALDCTLAYALVPNTTLQATVERQARRLAGIQVDYVETTMALEDQSVGADWREENLNRLTEEWIGRRDLWKQSSASLRPEPSSHDE